MEPAVALVEGWWRGPPTANLPNLPAAPNFRAAIAATDIPAHSRIQNIDLRPWNLFWKGLHGSRERQGKLPSVL